jgi:hypothetical protein
VSRFQRCPSKQALCLLNDSVNDAQENILRSMTASYVKLQWRLTINHFQLISHVSLSMTRAGSTKPKAACGGTQKSITNSALTWHCNRLVGRKWPHKPSPGPGSAGQPRGPKQEQRKSGPSHGVQPAWWGGNPRN